MITVISGCFSLGASDINRITLYVRDSCNLPAYTGLEAVLVQVGIELWNSHFAARYFILCAMGSYE